MFYYPDGMKSVRILRRTLSKNLLRVLDQTKQTEGKHRPVTLTEQSFILTKMFCADFEHGSIKCVRFFTIMLFAEMWM